MSAPKMPEIRQTLERARGMAGREDTEQFALEAPGLLAQLVRILDLYIGHEPTLAEEADYVRATDRAEALAEAVALILAARDADEAEHPDDIAHINRRVGMREAAAILRRQYEPQPEPSRRPKVRRDAPAGQAGPSAPELNESAEPATVEFTDGTVTLTHWRLTELAPDYYGHTFMQLDGWLPEGWKGAIAFGTNCMVRANLPGASAHAHNINVQIEVKGYGGPRRFMKIQWRHAYDPTKDHRRTGGDAR